MKVSGFVVYNWIELAIKEVNILKKIKAK